MLIDEFLDQIVNKNQIKILKSGNGRKLRYIQEWPKEWLEEYQEFSQTIRTIELSLSGSILYVACHEFKDFFDSFLRPGSRSYDIIDKVILDLSHPNSIQELKKRIKLLCPSTNN